METGESEVKRRRLAIACLACRRKKSRCDKQRPRCSQCMRSKQPTSCVYADWQSDDHIDATNEWQLAQSRSQLKRGYALTPLFRVEKKKTEVETTIEHLMSRVEELEGRLQRGTNQDPKAQPGPVISGSENGDRQGENYGPALTPVGTPRDAVLKPVHKPISNPSNSAGADSDSSTDSSADPSSPPKMVKVDQFILAPDVICSKTRVFGRSHWAHNTLKMSNLLRKLLDKLSHGDAELDKRVYNCKQLIRKIKKHRYAVTQTDDPRQLMPPKEVADILVEAYLNTFDKIHRILYVPYFRQGYEQYWKDPAATDTIIVLKILMVLTIGRCFHPELVGPRAHYDWVFAVQTWASNPFVEKARMSIAGLQIQCLLVIAREVNAIGGDLIWIHTGNLVRTAIYMGLNRDPSNHPNTSNLDIEIRRRLWWAILELNVNACITAGTRPMISESDYDTLPPSNINDEKNVCGAPQTSMPLTTYTDSSVQILFTRTLALRMEVANAVNGTEDLEYDAVLSLDKRLTEKVDAAMKLLETYSRQAGVASNSSDGTGNLVFQTRIFEAFNLDYHLVLHSEFATAAMTSPEYYFSRRACLLASLRLLEDEYRVASNDLVVTGYPGKSSQSRNRSGDRQRMPESNEVRSLLNADPPNMKPYRAVKIQGGGIYRAIFLNACSFCCIEALSMPENAGTHRLSPIESETRTHLLKTIEGYAHLGKVRFAAGHTNFKGHCFLSTFLAQVQAQSQSKSPEDTMAMMMRQLGDSLEDSLEVLKQVEQSYMPTENTGEILFEPFEEGDGLESFEKYLESFTSELLFGPLGNVGGLDRSY